MNYFRKKGKKLTPFFDNFHNATGFYTPTAYISLRDWPKLSTNSGTFIFPFNFFKHFQNLNSRQYTTQTSYLVRAKVVFLHIKDTYLKLFRGHIFLFNDILKYFAIVMKPV